MTIRPAYGIPSLHLRQPTSHLLETCGKPSRRTKAGPLREYWLYPNFGFDCLISTKSKRILSIFFRPAFSLGTLEEWNWDETIVRKNLKTPSRVGGDVDIAKTHINKWFSYDSGIGFHFEPSGRIAVISTFSAKRKTAQKILARHQPASVTSLAAFSVSG